MSPHSDPGVAAAVSAINFRRPSKVFEELVAQGGIGLRSLALRGASPLEGGIPIIVDGKIVGAIGVSNVCLKARACHSEALKGRCPVTSS